MSQLSLNDREKLEFCLDEMRGFTDETVTEWMLVKAAISANFDSNRALNHIMDASTKPRPIRTKQSSLKDEVAVINAPTMQKTPLSAKIPPATATAQTTTTTMMTTTTQQNFATKTTKPKSTCKQSETKPSKFENRPQKHELHEYGAEVEETPTRLQPSASTSSLLKISSKAKLNRLDPAKEFQARKDGGKEYLNLVVVGHVDAGKSTLMGHVLYQLGFVSKRVMHKYEQDAKKLGKGSFAYAWVLDETEEERSRGVTMDVAQTTFETNTKVVTLNDAPGHKDFIPNMITGAAQADVAILVINAIKGEFETGFEMGGQTREHAILIRSLGVTQLLVAVSKMDKIDWSEERFKEIVGKLRNFFKQTGFKDSDVVFVPCSGLAGENLTKPSNEPRFSWYKGPTLVEQIDKFKPAVRPALDKPLRLSVTDVFKSVTSGFSLGGIINSGNVQVGDKVLIAPANEILTVKSMFADSTKVPIAFAGDSIALSVSDIDPSKVTIGSILCNPSFPVQMARSFRARIVIFNVSIPILKGFQVVIHYQSLTEQAHLSQLISQLHRSTGEVVKKKPRWLDKNSSALVDIRVDRPICLELYSECKDLGRFMLRHDGVTIAAGLVVEIFKEKAKNQETMRSE